MRSLALLLALPLIAFSGHASADAPLTKKDVQDIIQQEINDHPEMLVKALQSYQVKQRETQLAEMGKNLSKVQDQLKGDNSAPTIGNPKGDVTVVEFFDYHCGYCKHVTPTITKLLEEDKNIRFVFKEFPILSPDSETAAKAALAVYRIAPAKYFQFHSELMQNNGAFDDAYLGAQAQKFGISLDKLKKEMANPAVAAEIESTRAMANDLGIRGTPAFIIGGQLVPGSMEFDEIKAKIKAERDSRAKK